MAGCLWCAILMLSFQVIQVQGQEPQMMVQHFVGNQIIFTCSLPRSVKHDTKCNLYFGEASRPIITTTVGKKSSSNSEQRFCQFFFQINNFLRHLDFVQQKDASCDYSLQKESLSLSYRSVRYNLKDCLQQIKAQAIASPELTLNPPAITETDSVTLNCQTPSSVSVSQCDFYIASQKLSKGSSCVQTLTATELLEIAHMSLPAEVEIFFHLN
ncbi:uncharacterized protein LOC120440233 [Oreochromis aureus]|uniref:uncharacterized protein LOC120440233 n=1 Tax=Oreochromis aureus TaxID=47969 RepID=UPI001954A7A4|nr:uncharacterized protein LOC120440233 [Oreochromis aureus]